MYIYIWIEQVGSWGGKFSCKITSSQPTQFTRATGFIPHRQFCLEEGFMLSKHLAVDVFLSFQSVYTYRTIFHVEHLWISRCISMYFPCISSTKTQNMNHVKTDVFGPLEDVNLCCPLGLGGFMVKKWKISFNFQYNWKEGRCDVTLWRSIFINEDESTLPFGKLRWQWRSLFSIGNTSSKGPFSIAMLVYQSVICFCSRRVVPLFFETVPLLQLHSESNWTFQTKGAIFGSLTDLSIHHPLHLGKLR